MSIFKAELKNRLLRPCSNLLHILDMNLSQFMYIFWSKKISTIIHENAKKYTDTIPSTPTEYYLELVISKNGKNVLSKFPQRYNISMK